MFTESVTQAEFDVPDEGPETRCPYCERPFRSERFKTFHIGQEHDDEWTDAEVTVYEEEYDDEEFELFTFHVKILVLLLVTYFTFTFFYALSLG